MTKLKLIRRQTSQGRSSTQFTLQDINGNRHILKATVVSVDQEAVAKSASSALEDEQTDVLGLEGRVIEPPLSLGELSVLSEFSTELRQTIDAMSIGIDGFGGRLLKRTMPKELETQFAADIEDEFQFLTTFLEYPNPDESFVELRRSSRGIKEKTGNAYWELVPTPTNEARYSCINLLDTASIRITRADRTFTRMWLNFVKPDFTLGRKIFQKRFRRFVQIVGGKKVFFKEFCDPRVIDRRTGDVASEDLPREHRANEVFHDKIKCYRRTPYGMPRFTGNIISIKGSRQADETNLITLMNNNIPSFAVLANGAMLTQGSVERIREFVQSQIAGSSNYSKWLILEGESSHDGLSGPTSAKIEIVPLTKSQHSDMLFQSYDENNAKKLRRNFRIAPILVGASENYDRSTAQVSEGLTEKYVFNPEREAEDRSINKILLQQGIRFWTYKSNSPNVTNDEDLVRILTGAERTGGLTPRIARSLLEDILNRDLPGFDEMPEDFNPDVPFSYTLAKLMQSAGAANQNGTLASQGQTPRRAAGSEPETASAEAAIEQMLAAPERFIEELTGVRDELTKKLRKESFGEAHHDPSNESCC